MTFYTGLDPTSRCADSEFIFRAFYTECSFWEVFLQFV